MTETDAITIVALARSNMNICEAARRSHYHRRSIEYHIGKIRRITSLDPQNFFRPGRVVYYGSRAPGR